MPTSPIDNGICCSYIQSLKMIVNLSNLKELDIAWDQTMQMNSILLNILKEAPYLSSISIDQHSFESMIGNNELATYLNKMLNSS